MNVTAVPMIYRGTKFRSTLEADWAATFDWYDIYWEYEPIAIELRDGIQYRPDFYLPEAHIWCEVKGPADERLEKPMMLNAEIWSDDQLEREPFVILLRPSGPEGRATWESCNRSMAITLYKCPQCREHSFADMNGQWRCRLVKCRAVLEKWDLRQMASGEPHFERGATTRKGSRMTTPPVTASERKASQ